MLSNDAGLIVWTLLSILLPIGALVGVVLVVRFLIRLSRRIERLSLSVDELTERLDRARDVEQ